MTLHTVAEHGRRSNASIYAVILADADNRDARPGVLKKLAARMPARHSRHGRRTTWSQRSDRLRGRSAVVTHRLLTLANQLRRLPNGSRRCRCGRQPKARGENPSRVLCRTVAARRVGAAASCYAGRSACSSASTPLCWRGRHGCSSMRAAHRTPHGSHSRPSLQRLRRLWRAPGAAAAGRPLDAARFGGGHAEHPADSPVHRRVAVRTHARCAVARATWSTRRCPVTRPTS